MTLVAALKDATYTVGDIRKVGYAVVAGSEEAGWLLCDGRPVSRSTYQTLFNKISTAYGIGDGSTTFNLPDAQGRSLIGTGQGAGLTLRALGAKGGVEKHTLVTTEMPNHAHGGGNHDHNTGGNGYGTGGESAGHVHTGGTGGASSRHQHNIGANTQATRQGTSAGNILSGLVSYGGGTQPNVPTSDDLVDHSHGFTTNGNNVGHQHGIYAQANITAEGGGIGHENMSPYLAVSVLIKT